MNELNPVLYLVIIAASFAIVFLVGNMDGKPRKGASEDEKIAYAKRQEFTRKRYMERNYPNE